MTALAVVLNVLVLLAAIAALLVAAHTAGQQAELGRRLDRLEQQAPGGGGR